MRALAVALAMIPVVAAAEPVYHYDFERSADFADYEALTASSEDVEIVSPGAGGEGQCLRIATTEPGKYCTLTISHPFEVVRNLVLSFDYRTRIEDARGLYLGILFFEEDNTQYGRFDQRFSEQWRRATVRFDSLRSPNEGDLRAGLRLRKLNLYGRAPDEGAMMTVWLDNIRLEARSVSGTLSETTETSWANPPLLVWETSQTTPRLQYSRSPDFPADATVEIETPRQFHTPDEPLEPGEWYWRVWTQSELNVGWGTIHRLHIPERAHTFTTEPVDAAAIAATPRPRLIDVRAERERRSAEDIEALGTQARSSAEKPIPDDPPIYSEDDERWGSWIDWYRDVHGGITSRTGRRLEQMAQWAAITGDEQVREWTLELALAVAAWDPEGGSAVGRGDIGAQHVLRGLSHAYDVLHDHASHEERAAIRGAIVARAEDFWDTLAPLHGSPYNNHAWLRALALGQAGLVLIGDHDDAAAWAEYTRELYLGKFLCGLGFQGDNNEGLSYWSYGLGFIIEYADMMRQVCGIDLYEHPWLSQTARFPLCCAPPHAWGVSFADSGRPNHSIRGPYATRYMRMLGERTGDPYALWYAGAHAPVDGVMPRPPLDIPQSIHYRFIGLAVANTTLVDGREGVTFAMHSGPYWAGHQHADQNAFVINAYGEKLAIDSGYYDWYGSPHFEQYSMQTVAHNTILVDGQGQADRTRSADGRIDAWFDGTGHSWVVGDASDLDVYEGELTRFERRALFVKPDLAVIHDLLAADEPSRFQWLLHTVAPIDLDGDEQQLDVTSGEAAMRARFLRPTGLQFEVTDEYPVHPYDGYGTVPVPEDELAQEWHLTASAEPATEREFLTAIDVRRSDAEPAAIRAIDCVGGHGLQAARGARRTTVLLAPDRKPVALSAGELRAVAEAVALTTEEGALASACAVNASELRWRGRTLLAVDGGAADCSMVATAGGTLAHLSLPSDATVTLPAGERVLVDGAASDIDAGERTMRLHLSAGEHTVAWGERPRSAMSREAEPLVVDVDGATMELAGYVRRRATDTLRGWWGSVALPDDDRYELAVRGIEGAAPALTWDGRTVALQRDGARATGVIWDQPGEHSLTVLSSGAVGSISLQAQDTPSISARMLPKPWSPPDDAVLHEAEDVAEEGAIGGKLMEKVGASGGIAHAVWDTPGQWARWRIDVPAEGDYHLAIRGASVYSRIFRELRIDGELLQIASFASTGGWCRTTDDWRWFRLMADEAGPLVIHLTEGRHQLRMTQLTGSMNLDAFALVPVQANTEE